MPFAIFMATASAIMFLWYLHTLNPLPLEELLSRPDLTTYLRLIAAGPLWAAF